MLQRPALPTVLVLVLLLWLAPLPAFGARARSYTALDAGAFITNFYERVHTTKAYQGEVSRVAGFVRVRRGMPLFPRARFEPAFSLLLPWRSGNDGTVRTFTFQLALPLRWEAFEFLSLRLGPAVHSDLLFPVGEAVTLDNGTSTSSFYLPSEPRMVLLMAIQLGWEVKLSRRLSFHTDLYMVGAGDRNRRRVHGGVALGWEL